MALLGKEVAGTHAYAYSCSLFGPTQRSKCEELWAAILRSSGFRPDFPRWAWNELGLDIHLDGDSLSLLVDSVYEYANKLASARWRAKKTEFAVQIENSWKTKGGRMPFAMLREKPLPPVTDLRVCLHLSVGPPWAKPGFKLSMPVLTLLVTK